MYTSLPKEPTGTDRGLTSMVASTSEHLEKLARGGVLVDTGKGESLPGSFDKAGRPERVY